VLQVVLLFSIVSFINCACPSNTTLGSNNLCYRAYPTSASWAVAENTCCTSGGHLASVPDAFTNAWLSGFADAPLARRNYWMGGNYMGNMWTWSDCERFMYTSWAPGQGSNGNCIYQQITDGVWYSDDCNLRMPFVCEYEQVGIHKLCACMNGTMTTTMGPMTTTTMKKTTGMPGNCPSPDWSYNAVTNKCYYVSAQALNWNDSLTFCKQNFSASLATIHSDAENVIITTLYDQKFPDNVNPNPWVWIGLYDGQLTGNYSWIDGSPLDFMDWYPGYPSGPYACVHMDMELDSKSNRELGRWTNDNCSISGMNGWPNVGFVCELKF